MDDNFIAALAGHNLSDQQVDLILENIYKQLEERVGKKVADSVSDAQFEQFEGLIDSGNQEALDLWVEQNIPDYEQLVAQTLEQLKQEVLVSPAAFLTN